MAAPRSTLDTKRAERQMFELFATELGGTTIASAEGPNGSRLIWWNVNGFVVLVQLYRGPCGSGWDYYLPGLSSTVSGVKADITRYLEAGLNPDNSLTGTRG